MGKDFAVQTMSQIACRMAEELICLDAMDDSARTRTHLNTSGVRFQFDFDAPLSLIATV